MKLQSNCANGDLTTQRRNKFICALIAALRKVPIYGPGGGNPAIGEEGKPMYTVAVTNELAQENMKKAEEAKEKQRWDYQSSDSDFGDEKPSGDATTWQPIQYGKEIGTNSSSTTAIGLESNYPENANLSPFDTAATATGYNDNSLTHTDSRHSRQRSIRSVRSVGSRRQDIESVRQALQRGSTRGRRKVGATAASPPASSPPALPLISQPPPSNNQGSGDAPLQRLTSTQVRFTPQQVRSQVQFSQQPPFAGGHYDQQQPPPSGPLPPKPDEKDRRF